MTETSQTVSSPGRLTAWDDAKIEIGLRLEPVRRILRPLARAVANARHDGIRGTIGGEFSILVMDPIKGAPPLRRR